ncbi:MAG: RIP metalloprotease RseP, partial [Planctomycetota bacterium]
IIGTPTPGGAAWEAGVPPGSRVMRVNGEDIDDFEHLVTAVAVNGNEEVRLEVLAPGASEIETYVLRPQFDEEFGLYRIGLPAGISPSRKLVVREGTAAAAAGLTAEDQLVAVEGQPSLLSLDQQMMRVMLSGDPLPLRVKGPDGAERTVVVDPKSNPGERKLIGVAPSSTRIEAVRVTGPGHALVEALDIRAGDRILSVGATAIFDADGLRDALVEVAAKDDVLTLTVERGAAIVQLQAPLDGETPPLALAGDLAVQSTGAKGLGSLITVAKGSPAERAGLVDGDEIISINGVTVDTWESVLSEIRSAVERETPVEVLAYRMPEGADRSAPSSIKLDEIRVTLRPEALPAPEYGVGLAAAMTILRAATFKEAMSKGISTTVRFFSDVWQQLQKMLFSKDISTKNLGGIISISVISSDAASQGLPVLFKFLAILSINLAIINLLPIPILDGGHLLFLLIEGIKGSPVSERTFGYSQVVGLVMIMSLMVYVTYQDIVRWFLQP